MKLKTALLLALLLISVALLGCVKEQQPSAQGTLGTEAKSGQAGAPGEVEKQSFASEGEAFSALEKELANTQDLSPEELEQALQK